MKTILTICLILICSEGYSQLHLSAHGGYGFFEMSEIKALQQRQLSSFAVDAEITSSFPPYWIYGLSGKALMAHDLMLGMSVAIGSTGGRMYYEDYSGKVGVDHLLRFTSLSAAFGGWGKSDRANLYYLIDLSPGVTFTSMKMRGFQSIGQYRHNEETTILRSLNVTVQPTLTAIKQFNRLGINIFVGYHLTIVPGKVKLKGNKDAYLVYESDPVNVDWSGIRAGVGVTLFFVERSSEGL